MAERISIPDEAVGLKLFRIVGDDLIACEAVRFTDGKAAVVTVLLRAAISGRVEIGGEIADHFADILDDDQSMIETVALDAKSYGALKNHWMRCRLERAA
jgi:hypothetical protein